MVLSLSVGDNFTVTSSTITITIAITTIEHSVLLETAKLAHGQTL